MKKPLVLTFVFLFLFSCQKERVDCPDVVELGKFFLTDNSKELFPYDLSESKLIFIDEVDTDVKANSSGNSPASKTTLIYNAQCKDDKNLEITLEAEVESIRTSISFEALNKKFDLSLSPMIPGDYYTDKSLKGIDFMQISYYDSIQFQAIPKHKAVITVLVDDRGGIMEYVPNTDQAISSLVLNGIEYENVYTNRRGSDVVKFYYNHEVGIIGFEDQSTGKSYWFDRYE